jgi:triosephosphate isomerase
MRQLIAGNWKMNGLTAEAAALTRAIVAGAADLSCDLLICPPFTQLVPLAGLLAGTPVALGAQDCHAEPKGAHTGDISAAMLRDIGCRHVILGHSERRRDHGEIDEAVRQKAVAATEAGLVPIVCVGESEDQRAAGQETETVGWQIEGSLPKGYAGIVAYEPIWAIGTGNIPTGEQVAAMHGFIRDELLRQFGDAGAAIRILYGGSVKPDNAAMLLAIDNVDGALVGGASLSAADFLAIAGAKPAGN